MLSMRGCCGKKINLSIIQGYNYTHFKMLYSVVRNLPLLQLIDKTTIHAILFPT